MIFYHVSRPHPAHSGASAPPLVRICATVDQEQDELIQLAPYWLKRPRPGESVASDSYRARHSGSTVGPSIYVPPALHGEIPPALIISDYEIGVTTDLRALNRARFRRDFSPHHQGIPFNRVRQSLYLCTNQLLLHTVRQFMRTCPAIMFTGQPFTDLHTPAALPGGVLAPDGTRFDPLTGEII